MNSPDGRFPQARRTRRAVGIVRQLAGRQVDAKGLRLLIVVGAEDQLPLLGRPVVLRLERGLERQIAAVEDLPLIGELRHALFVDDVCFVDLRRSRRHVAAGKLRRPVRPREVHSLPRRHRSLRGLDGQRVRAGVELRARYRKSAEPGDANPQRAILSRPGKGAHAADHPLQRRAIFAIIRRRKHESRYGGTGTRVRRAARRLRLLLPQGLFTPRAARRQGRRARIRRHWRSSTATPYAARRDSSRPPARAGIRALVGRSRHSTVGSLPLLVASRAGYQNLCRLITRMKAGRRERQRWASGWTRAKGPSTARRAGRGRDARPAAGSRTAPGAADAFGRENVYVDVQRHLRRTRAGERGARATWRGASVTSRSRRTASPRARARPRAVRRAHVRAREADARRGGPAARAQRRAPPEVSRRRWRRSSRDVPDASRNGGAGARLDFTLADLGYEFPHYPVPAGGDDARSCASRRGGRARPLPPVSRDARARQIERELALIEKLDLAGYFLIVWDIVNFCREQRHPRRRAAARAANSAVCYCARHHRRRSGRAWICSSSASSPRSAASGRTSISTCRAATGASA